MEEKSNDQVSSEQRKILISQHPLFKSLSSDLIDELVSLSIQKNYSTGDVIVSQGEIVDSIYFIAVGEVEVDRVEKETQLIPQATLKKGDPIGLDQFGFFSTTGLRTASLNALSDCVLIGWELEVFSSFLKKHPDAIASMRQSSEIFLRMNFIKQVEPFADLPKETIAWLSTNIEEITVPSDAILFRQGDVGQECYLVLTGEVEIILTDEAGNERTIAALKPSMLFGEMALLTSAKRNETAKMSQGGKLLVIKKDQFNHLMQFKSTTEAMMLLSFSRTRPLKNEDVEHYFRKMDDGVDVVILKDTRRKKYFQLSEEGWFIWQLLDGTKSLQELAIALLAEKKVFSPDAIADIVVQLAESGFVQLPGVPFHLVEKPRIKPRTRMQKLLRHLLFFELRFDDIDDRMTQIFRWVQAIFRFPGQVILGITILAGLFLFCLFAPQVFEYLQSTQHLILVIVLLVIINMASTVIHELAHGFATKFFKHEVHRACFLFSWLGFIAFVDTSDMWLSDKRSKIIVSMAGPIADLGMAGLAGIFAWLIPQADIALLLWLLALTLYYGVYKNLNPFMENDGYLIMKDAFNSSNLREDALIPLFFHQSQPKKKRSETIYLWNCATFMVVEVVLAFIFQHYLRLLLPKTILGVPTYHLIWLLPSLVLLKYIVTIKKVIRNYRMRMKT